MRKRLTHIILEEGKVTKDQIEKAFILQMRRGGRIGSNLVQLGFISEEDLSRALSRIHMKPAVPRDAFKKIDRRLKELIPPDLAQKYRVIPIKEKNRTLIVAMESPDDLEALKELEFIIDRQIIPWVCPQIRMDIALDEVYGIKRNLDYSILYLKEDELAKKGYEDKRGFISIDERISSTDYGRAILEIKRANSIEEIGEAIITYAGSIGKRAILFVIKSRDNIVRGWKGYGSGLNDFVVRDYRIGKEEMEGLLDRLEIGNYYYGKRGSIPGNEVFYNEISSKEARDVLICPIFIRGKMIFILYADNGPDPFDKDSIESILTLSQIASMALEGQQIKGTKG